jgi:hypothetical protein
MKTSIISFVTAAFVLLFVTSCQKQPSDAVDQSRIRTDYELFYDKNTNKTTAIAAFRFGESITGTVLELSGGAQVKFNNDVLVYNTFLSRYEKEYTGLVSAGTFTYRDVNGKVLTNTVQEIKAIDFPANPATLTISKAQEFLLNWEGSPLVQNDGVGVLIGTLVFTETTFNATRVRMTPAQLQSANTGAYVAFMDRTTLYPLQQQTNTGGSIITKYRAVNKNVSITN